MSKELSVRCFNRLSKLWPKTLNLAFYRAIETSLIISLLASTKKPQNVIDLGCGDGAVYKTITELLGFKPFSIGVDISVKALKRACEGNRYDVYINADIRKLPIRDDITDLVLSVSVIEHVQECHSSLEEMRRILRKSGSLFITMPTNTFTHNFLISHILQIFPGSLRKEYIMKMNRKMMIVNYFSDNHWVKLLDKSGLRVLKIVGHMPTLSVIFLDLIGKLPDMKLLKQKLVKLLLRKFTYAYPYINDFNNVMFHATPKY